MQGRLEIELEVGEPVYRIEEHAGVRTAATCNTRVARGNRATSSASADERVAATTA
jgi:hypothetical protein